MAGQRITMMELNTLIRLKRDGWSNRKIAKSLHLDHKTVDAYVNRFNGHQLDYEHLFKLSESELQDLFTQESQVEKERYETLSGYFTEYQKELKKTGSTLQELNSVESPNSFKGPGSKTILLRVEGMIRLKFRYQRRHWYSDCQKFRLYIHKLCG